MSNNFYLARQPILDLQQKTMGYELLYRDSEQSSAYANERHATAALLVNVLNQAGLQNVVGNSLAFVNIDDRFLRHEIVDTIPAKTFIFEITTNTSLDVLTVERIEVLHKKGYSFCLDASQYAHLSKYEKIFPYLSYCKIDTSSFSFEHLEEIVRTLHSYDIKAIATKVEMESAFQIYKEKGFDAFQGYYFAEPKIIKDQKLDADQASLFKLCNLLQTGGDTSEIVESFERSPSLTLQLLRFMNSAAFHFKAPISSIQQVITLLGRNSLNQWLMLLLYSKSLSSNGNFDNPLILLVKQRTDLMVSLLKMTKKNCTMQDLSEAYFVGVLSLMNTLLHMPLYEILEEFHVDERVKDALYDRIGELGELYAVTLAIENFDTEKIDTFVYKYSLDMDAFEKMMLSSIQATTEFEKASLGE
jgi:EAL and modified HD-GYP domain-containing signal transduction protein